MALGSSSRKKSFPEVVAHSAIAPYRSSIIFFVLALALVVASYSNASMTQQIRSSILSGVAPVVDTLLSPVHYVSDMFGSVSGLAELSAANQALMVENTKLKQWHQVAVSLKDENEKLRNLLNAQAEPEKNFITTRVIADAGSQFVQSFIIPVGQDKGVEKGQAVLSDKAMIGRIVEVGQSASRVLLLTDLNSRVPVTFEGTDIRAVLSGQNDGTPRLLHLPPKVEITDGASILTSGHGGVLPAGLLLGKIKYNEDGDPKVELLGDPHKASYVRIVDYDLDPSLKTGKIK